MRAHKVPWVQFSCQRRRKDKDKLRCLWDETPNTMKNKRQIKMGKINDSESHLNLNLNTYFYN